MMTPDSRICAPLRSHLPQRLAGQRVANRLRMQIPAALALGVSLALAACQTDAVRDSRGTIAQLSDWQEIQPFQADLNFPLGITRIRKVEKQIRDNSIVHNRIYFDFDRGLLRSERLYDGFFSEVTHMRLNDVDRFAVYVKKFLGDHYVRHDAPQKVTHPRYTSGGFVTTADAFGGRTCIVARTGYKFSEPSYDNDPGTYDTVVFLRYCDFNAQLDEFLPILASLEVVEDRAEFRAALNERRAATKKPASKSSPKSADTYVTCESKFGLVSTMKQRICWSTGGRVIR